MTEYYERDDYLEQTILNEQQRTRLHRFLYTLATGGGTENAKKSFVRYCLCCGLDAKEVEVLKIALKAKNPASGKKFLENVLGNNTFKWSNTVNWYED